MAITLNYADPMTRANIPGAYVRVARFLGDKAQVRAELAVYASKDARETKGVRPVVVKTLTVPYGGDKAGPGGTGLLAYLYGVVKALPEFAGATDC